VSSLPPPLERIFVGKNTVEDVFLGLGCLLPSLLEIVLPDYGTHVLLTMHANHKCFVCFPYFSLSTMHGPTPTAYKPTTGQQPLGFQSFISSFTIYIFLQNQLQAIFFFCNPWLKQNRAKLVKQNNCFM
jgi:hypothetical protein